MELFSIGSWNQYSFLELLCSTKVRDRGEDTLYWLPSLQKGFKVSSFYGVLSWVGGCSFPWRSIWNPKVPSRVFFFLLVASLGKLLTFENLRKQNIIVVSWYCLCKTNGERLITCYYIVIFRRRFGTWSLLYLVFNG